MTANELIALAEGRVVLEWPDGVVAKRDGDDRWVDITDAASVGGTSAWKIGTVSVDSAVALALTIAAIEAGLAAHFMTFGVAYSREHCRDPERKWACFYSGLGRIHQFYGPTRADALAALLKELPKVETNP